MNFKIPAIVSAVSFVLIFIINILVKNPILTVFMRSLLSALFLFGIVLGVIFVLVDILKIDFKAGEESESEPPSEEEGAQVDYLVGDETQADGLNEEFNSDDGDIPDEVININPSIDENSYDTGDMDEDYIDDDEEDGAIGVDAAGETIKEKLGMHASTEDLAKAVKTVIKRDGR